MKAIGCISRMINKYGTSLTMNAASSPLHGKVFCAFVQPLRYKNKMYLDGTFSPVGYVDQAYYLYIGPPEIDICSLPESASVAFSGRSYNFTRRERVVFGKDKVYYWSVLRAVIPEGETV